MLRGINRSIIEINETENRYFERVLIFVRPEFGNFPENHLKKEAAKLISGISTQPVGLKNRLSARSKARKKKKRIILGISLGILAAALFLTISLL